MNLVNYGRSSDDNDMTLTFRMLNKSNVVEIYDKYNDLVDQIIQYM